MINIYVDELPKSCKECKCAFNTFRQRVNETGSYMEECMCCIPLNEWLVEKHPNCPLKPLSDRLAEERKKVVQELKQRLIEYTGFDEEYLSEHIFDVDAGCLLKQIDKFERGE